MKRLLRTGKLTILTLVLALGGLTFAATATPAAHAAPTPFLSYINQGGGVYVDGYAFTPGIAVRLEVLSSDLTKLLNTQYPIPDSAGEFGILLQTPGYTGSAQVFADQAGSPTVGAQPTILHDPYITATTSPASGGAVGIEADGSGYYPGATVKVLAYQWTFCGFRRFCQKVLSTQYYPVSTDTLLRDDPGRIFAGGLSVPVHSGTVYVTTYGGAPAASNTVSLYIP